MLARTKRHELLIADDDSEFRRTLCDVLEPYYQTVESPRLRKPSKLFSDSQLMRLSWICTCG